MPQRRDNPVSPALIALAVAGVVFLVGLLIVRSMTSDATVAGKSQDKAAANDIEKPQAKPPSNDHPTNEKPDLPPSEPPQLTEPPLTEPPLTEPPLTEPPPTETPPSETSPPPTTPKPPPTADHPPTNSDADPDADPDAPFDSLLNGDATNPNPPPPPDNRLPLPDEAAVAAKEKEIRSLFAKEFATTRPQETWDFGRKLLVLARETAGDPTGRYAALLLAIDRAAKVGDSETARAAAQEIAEQYAADRLSVVGEALLSAARGAVPLAARPQLVADLLAIGEEAYESDRLPMASSLARAALDAARSVRDLSVVEHAVELGDRIAAAQTDWPAVRAALATLAKTPEDAAANAVVGRYCVFRKDDWKRGLAHLALSDDAALRKVAELELSAAPTPVEMVVAADGWWSIADGVEPPARRRIQIRALSWYRRARDVLPDGLEKLRVAKRLADSAYLDELPSDAVLVLTFEPDTLNKRGNVALAADRSKRKTNVLLHEAKLVEGACGQGLFFDAANQFGEAGNPPMLRSPAAVTVCAWVKPTPSGDGPADVASKDDWKGPARGFVLRHFKNSHLDFTVGNRDWNSIRSPDPLVNGEWQHVAGSFDAREIRLFLDGKLISRKALERPMVPSPLPLSIGRGTYAKDRVFNGSIDELAIFTRALTEKEVEELHRAGAAGMRLAK